MEVQEQLPLEERKELYAFLDSIIPMGARVQGQNLEQHMSEYDTNKLKEITAPALVMHAKDDSLVFMEQGEFAANKIPGARLIPMARGGHLALMFSSNKDAKNLLQKFIDNNNASKSTE